MLYHDDFLTRLEQCVRAALPCWGLGADATVALLSVSENATFRVDDPEAGPLAIRVYRPGYHDRLEIRSELDWIEALRTAGVVATARPIPLVGGDLIADIDDAGTRRHAVAFEFLPGHEPTVDDDLPAWFFQLGAIHARLHAHARRWRRPPGFTRKVWNFASTLGEKPLWGDFRDGLGLDAAGRTLLERAAARLEDKLRPLDQPESFGLIHADMRLANLLVDDDRLALIDFDDCGFSWFLYDFAAAISFLEHEPYVPALKAAWMEGYRTAAPLPAAASGQIDLLVMLRRILLTAWIASHRETPTARAAGPAYTDGTLALAETFLSRHG